MSPPRGELAMSEDIFGCPRWKMCVLLTTDGQRPGMRAANHRATHRTAPTQKEGFQTKWQPCQDGDYLVNGYADENRAATEPGILSLRESQRRGAPPPRPVLFDRSLLDSDLELNWGLLVLPAWVFCFCCWSQLFLSHTRHSIKCSKVSGDWKALSEADSQGSDSCLCKINYEFIKQAPGRIWWKRRGQSQRCHRSPAWRNPWRQDDVLETKRRAHSSRSVQKCRGDFTMMEKFLSEVDGIKSGIP